MHFYFEILSQLCALGRGRTCVWLLWPLQSDHIIKVIEKARRKKSISFDSIDWLGSLQCGFGSTIAFLVLGFQENNNFVLIFFPSIFTRYKMFFYPFLYIVLRSALLLLREIMFSRCTYIEQPKGSITLSIFLTVYFINDLGI